MNVRLVAVDEHVLLRLGLTRRQDQRDAAGFIKLNALRLRTLAMRKRKS